MAMWMSVLLGCGTQPTEPVVPRSRVDAVLVEPKPALPPAEFCETWAEEGAGTPFPMPTLAGTTWKPSKGWRWVNVWATWCGPCVAEMPRLVEWRDKLGRDGSPIELVFVSVDAGQAELDRFYAQKRNFPPTVRIADLATLPDWLAALGLDATTPIPIHLFVGPTGEVRCVRTGAISEDDYAAVKGVVGS